MLSGPVGRVEGAINPYEKLNAKQLTDELWERKLVRDVLDVKTNAQKMQKELKEHLCGTSRIPALCFNNSSSTMEDLNLKQYEVSPIEPLHDTKGHIKNIWDILPEVSKMSLSENFSGRNLCQMTA